MPDTGQGALAQKLLGQPGRFSGFSKFLDIQQAFVDAQRQHQYTMQQNQQAGNLAAAKGIAEAGLTSGETPDAQTAMNQYQQMSGQAPLTSNSLATGDVPTPTYTSDTGQKLYGKAGRAEADKKSAEQDRIEQNVRSRLSSVRGDAPMAKIEVQRDAAGLAYNALQTAENENRLPNQIEYFDILGQTWKARTGTAPTEQVLNELNVGTVQQKLNKLYQYTTGQMAPANTADVIKGLKNFIYQSGISLDQAHEGYMKAHLVKPKGMSQERFDEIKGQATRGNSFAEGIKIYKDSLGQSSSGGQSGPSVGTVEGGYRFKGGDPSKSTSWTKI